MAQLNTSERHILKHPPTPESWECGRKTEKVYVLDDGTTTRATVACIGLMSGSHATCTYCQEPRRRGAKLLWPRYAAACTKAGIEPGTPWPVRAEPDAEAVPPKRPTKQKGA